MNKLITREQFERQYARSAYMRIDDLRGFGQVAVPCNCDYKLCQGWQMVNRDITRHNLLSKGEVTQSRHIKAALNVLGNYART